MFVSRQKRVITLVPQSAMLFDNESYFTHVAAAADRGLSILAPRRH